MSQETEERKQIGGQTLPSNGAYTFSKDTNAVYCSTAAWSASTIALFAL